MRYGAPIFLAAALACEAYALDPRLTASVYGDARMAYEGAATLTNILFDVQVPPGDHNALTFTGWLRIAGCPSNTYLTTQAFYTPERVQYSNPSLIPLCGGYHTNLTLSGAVSWASFPWQPYADPVISNRYPKAVYTVDGSSSNAVTVTLGGTDYTFGPGEFNRNVIPGPADSLAISGAGAVRIGISRTPDYQFFGEIDGVAAGISLTAESIVTNEISFCAWRILLNGTQHIYRSDLTRIDKCTAVGVVKTNALPRSARSLSSGGIYRLGLVGVVRDYEGYQIEAFDFRSFAGWLTDDELNRIHGNGAEEIGRRGIPRWK